MLGAEAKWKTESNTERMLGRDPAKASAQWGKVGCGRVTGAKWAELRGCVGFEAS